MRASAISLGVLSLALMVLPVGRHSPVTGEALRYLLVEGAPRLADPDGVLLPGQFD